MTTPIQIPQHKQKQKQKRSSPGLTGANITMARASRRHDGQSTSNTNDAAQEQALVVTESWVEIASQPSSSSLSSIGGDDVVTAGLLVGTDPYPPRRRRLHQQQYSFAMTPPTAAKTATSSQDEYDETESEEDRLLTSSTENMQPTASIAARARVVSAMPAAHSDTDSDSDENATALGRPSHSSAFKPQPNAFSHPPSHLTHRHSTCSSLPQHPQHPSSSRPPRAGPTFRSPSSYQADHDAALRASLTTLLSCAAAARGLSKKDEHVAPTARPMELKLVPESELMVQPSPLPNACPRPPPARTASGSSAPCSTPSSDHHRTVVDPVNLPSSKSKRTAASQGTKTSPRMAKKKRTNSTAAVDGAAAAATTTTATTTFMSPTLFTWVVSAGVVVLVSVVGFGAGYVMGREVGRQEAGNVLSAASSSSSSAVATGNMSSSCGGDLARSGSGATLRRFRWGSVGRSAVA